MDGLKSVAKHNYELDAPEYTVWSVVYDQQALTATYYAHEDYDEGWVVTL